ncbi:unnamed protein product [Amaranthus hypochondriacus]
MGVDELLDLFRVAYNAYTVIRGVDTKCTDLRIQLLKLKRKVKNMTGQLNADSCDPCKEKKRCVEVFFGKAKSFVETSTRIMEEHGAGGLRSWIVVLVKLDKCLEEGKALLKTGDQMIEEGLTTRKVCTRGTVFCVEKPIGTAEKHRRDALLAIESKASIIAIHGSLGGGKTNLMKILHNDVCKDLEHFKAVFWAEMPQEQLPDIKRIQDCIAQAMKFKLYDEDPVRRSSLLARKMKDMAPGHVVLFLDNVKQHFPMHEVGISIGCNAAENFCCTLVFTTSSEDVCDQMGCSTSTKFKLGLLSEDEARELFMDEAGWNTRCTRSYSSQVEYLADEVAKQCARMPLVIKLIARSMTRKEDICEWRNRLNELMGTVEGIHGDEAKIVEQLKFSVSSIQDSTIQGCFLESACILREGHKLTKLKLIQHWVQKGRITKKRRRGFCATVTDQGHTIINILERLYLLEVVEELDGNKYVSMNKWIRKMAENITPEETTALCKL